MAIWELILLAVGLSMDAFAVAVCKGLAMQKVTAKGVLTVGGWFGGFQALMPCIGYFLMAAFQKYITAFDHWIAFGLLAFIGGKMLWEVFFGEDEEGGKDNPLQWKTLLLSAVATSIDAMAVGVTMALGRTGLLTHDLGFLLCAAVIALVTFALCLIGVQVGCKTGSCFGRRAQIAGGLVLIGIGVKILIEHLLG